MDIKQGDIYLYEPPISSSSEQSAVLVTSGSEQQGLRPFIIVSREVVHKNKPTAVGVPLTTKIEKANSYRIALPAAELIPEVGCMPFRDSVALCDHIRVIDRTRLRRKIGRVSENAVLSIGVGLAFVFDIR